ncbi:Calcineurin-like phosphoesterase superfamily domain protein [Caulifigura coniformis]|uniref:Calcineurin-like phosphoesterase superfamily domain protein n=1 Tax=Caulifigura coniformis TaxID=2527983 RepID=A0A517S8E0_9PLAN|nr:metallophosphoesterase [Caulifigura coniformis]QDT52387.1 Calcineurin-like phosphoesterase superfamily domain protein [Caulifigura coniformis]
MNLLLFSDLHADVPAARRLAALATQADLLIGAGDFGNSRRHVADCLPTLLEAGKPAVFVPGNSESFEELTDACRNFPNARVLHGTNSVIEGLTFFGLGGGIPVTPFGSWSYDFTEEQAAALLKDCPPAAVLVTHSPPKGAVDIATSGKSLGSTAIRAAIERTRPRLVVCGHIHASAGQQAQIGPTPIINPGPQGVLHELQT